MASFDPYAILGVARDASAEAVRQTYRRVAKRTHPDAGGKTEDFQAAARALAILEDDGARAHFDRTGEAIDKAIDLSEELALQAPNQCFQTLFLADADLLAAPNLMQQFDDALRQIVRDMERDAKKVERAHGRLLRMRKRFKDKATGAPSDRIERMLDWHERQMVESSATLRRKIKAHQRALEIIATLEFSPGGRLNTASSFGPF